MTDFTILKEAFQDSPKIRLHIEENDFQTKCTGFLNKLILEMSLTSKRPVITLCIGTDRSTGDSLGPLVGWLLKQKSPHNNFIYGTIDNPVHAINMVETINKINLKFDNPLIIAVDACLGKLNSIGYVSITKGSLKPGAAVNKNLPVVGDLAISGIVNVGGFMEYFVLQNTRLGLVMKMAEQISQVLYKIYHEKLD